MPKPKVFATRIIRDQGLDLIKDFCELDLWPEELPPSRETMLQHVRGVAGLLCLLTDQIDSAILEAASPGLKVISNHAVGYDNIDLASASSHRIPVGNTPGILTDATADFTFALLMAAGRRVVESERYVRQGKWQTWGPSILLGADFAGATLGLIGFGRIGQAVAKRASGFGMHMIYHDPNPTTADLSLNATPVDLDTLLRESDFISLHTPLTPETRHLINSETLAKMKASAVLVNTSRGPVVDQAALYAALKAKRLFGAALDVSDPEPLPPDSPLLTLENCLITPHIASASTRSRDKMALLAAKNLLAGLKGEPLPHCVNPEVYDGSGLSES